MNVQIWGTDISYRGRDYWFGIVWATSHLEGLFDSDIFLLFNSFCFGIWSLILYFFWFYQTHLEVTAQRSSACTKI